MGRLHPRLLGVDYLSQLIILLISTCVAVDAYEGQETCTAQEHDRGGALMQARRVHYGQQKHVQIDGQDQCQEKIVRIGLGGCWEQRIIGLTIPASLGWSKCTCNTDTPGFHWCTGSCANMSTCEAECLENPDCGGYSWVDRHCWMFKKMYMPSVQYNAPDTWYTCYAKERCCPNQCCPPFKGCGAWGDPHYTNTFHGGTTKLFDFMGLGLYRMAQSKDKSFELQAFQCPYRKGVAIFVAFAVKVAGYTISIVGKNVTINGTRYTSLSGSHPSGLQLSTLYAEGDQVSLEAPDNCAHFRSTNYKYDPAPNGWFNNMQVYLADEVASSDGICGSESNTSPIKGSNSLFSAAEMTYLCDLCNITDCEEQTPPDDWTPINSPEEACKNEGILMQNAEAKCADLKHDQSYFKACIFDYCASGGNEELVDNAVESKQVEQDPPLAVKAADDQPKCERPFKNCAAWGDPHYTASFYGAQFDWQGVGVFTMAKSNTKGEFELQAFQCPWGGTRGAVFAGFAMHVDGSRITIVQDNITINGKPFLGNSHGVGLRVDGAKTPRDTVHLDSKDNCVHFKINVLHNPTASPFYYHDIFLDVAQQVATTEGVCGSSAVPQTLTRDDALFSAYELDSLCQKCNMTDCVYMTPPAGWDPPANTIEACELTNMSIDVATEQCKTVIANEDPIFLADCVYDMCASNGDQTMAENAGESQQEGITRNITGTV